MPGNLALPTISQMGESAFLLTWGNRVSTRVNDRVHSLTRWLRHSLPVGVRDLVPAYASLLVVFDYLRISDADVRLWLREGIAASQGKSGDGLSKDGLSKGVHHVVPVKYGGESGPDLEELAAEEACSARDIVSAHTKRPFQVAFLGFLPGFAYMARLPRRSPVPRLATPRSTVPAGSVGIAGFQTGIYPFSSPGGWRIIGRTALQVWNPGADTPARFAPGDTVQFVESRYEPSPPGFSPVTLPLSRPAFEVLQVGGIGAIQDLGRPGFMDLGVGEGGAFDGYAAQRANALAGNESGAAVLELALGGPVLRVLRSVVVALDGADFKCRADSALIPPRLSWFVRAGTILSFAANGATLTRGMRAYLAVGGGFDVPPMLGSRSTSLLARFGGLEGRALRQGDVLGVGESRKPSGMLAGRNWPGHVRDISHKIITIRFTPFMGLQSARKAAFREFIANTWQITEQADRMGMRLKSPEGLRLSAAQRELASFGVVPGAIQLPPGGEPVVLGPDCQTTGGYPLLGVVAQADMPLLAQAAPGTHVQFVPVSVEDARNEARRAQAELEHGLSLLMR